jgi:hypothetical protein
MHLAADAAAALLGRRQPAGVKGLVIGEMTPQVRRGHGVHAVPKGS